MTHKSLRNLRAVDTQLASRADLLYRKVLRALLADHSHMAFLKPLSDLVRSNKWLEAVREADSLSEQKYSDATEHFVANQFALLIKKYPWNPEDVPLDPRATAIKTFRASEARCRLINRKLTFLSRLPSRDKYGKELGAARYWIRTVIGSTPNYRSIFDKSGFGPGASIGVHGNATSYLAKSFAKRWSVTPGALHHGYAAIKANYHLWESLLERSTSGMVCYDEEVAFANYLSRIDVVANNKISFVPKTAKTDRTIAVEPLLNSLVQKGIDEQMRKHLLRVGIDLRDQGLNQQLAREGSLDDSEEGYVTIDLKSASDSISIGIARLLLPDDWYRLLNRCRSHTYELDGELNVYHKFCSMGNGFCFPLETLVFASACFAVGAMRPVHDFIVYGDDIVIRKKYASALVNLLKHWGFKTNNGKTFLEGPFRESCGRDWFGGKDVRPFTLDYKLDSVENIFKYLNLTRRNDRSENFFHTVRGLVVSTLPENFRFFRPHKGPENTGIDSTGDEHLYSSTCRYLRNGRFSWLELSVSPYVDFDLLEKHGTNVLLVSDALRGSASISHGRFTGLPKVTLRNLSQTKVVRKNYASTSNWLPAPR